MVHLDIFVCTYLLAGLRFHTSDSFVFLEEMIYIHGPIVSASGSNPRKYVVLSRVFIQQLSTIACHKIRILSYLFHPGSLLRTRGEMKAIDFTTRWVQAKSVSVQREQQRSETFWCNWKPCPKLDNQIR